MFLCKKKSMLLFFFPLQGVTRVLPGTSATHKSQASLSLFFSGLKPWHLCSLKVKEMNIEICNVKHIIQRSSKPVQTTMNLQTLLLVPSVTSPEISWEQLKYHDMMVSETVRWPLLLEATLNVYSFFYIWFLYSGHLFLLYLQQSDPPLNGIAIYLHR